jgi:hypothetical protein
MPNTIGFKYIAAFDIFLIGEVACRIVMALGLTMFLQARTIEVQSNLKMVALASEPFHSPPGARNGFFLIPYA